MPKFSKEKLTLVALASLVVILMLFAFFRDGADSITLSEATMLLEDHAVTEVVASKDTIYLKTAQKVYKIPSSQISPDLLASYKVEASRGFDVLFYIFGVVALLAFGLFVRKRLSPMGETLFTAVQKDEPITQKLSPIEAIKSDVEFDDIGGISDVKVELEEIIDFMRRPKKYKDFGARLPRGVLLVGPPGVGKTMIAKAVANAAGVSFYYQSGASFVQIYVGMGAKRVHELFAAAKNNAPSIIFIDEIDAVGKKRDGSRNDEREATLNQLLTEMDGFESSSGVIVIAATNKIDVLDSALLRAGRFDRRIFVELPTKQERASILNKYLDKVPHMVDVEMVANMCVGFNGASLAALVNEAALLALRQKASHVTNEIILQVKDKVMFGKKKLRVLSPIQKEYFVTYQAAKALCATYLDLPFEKLLLTNEKLTPPSDEPLIQHELEARVRVLLSGMVACDIKYGEHSNMVKNDLEEAKELVSKMIEEYGMGGAFISSKDEINFVLKELYNSTKAMLATLGSSQATVESILQDEESISKSQIQQILAANG